MAKILGSFILRFSDIGGLQIHDDDAVDQLNHWATVGLLMALAAGTGAKQFVGTPIHCWLPAQYKNKMYQGYADSYCWINSMYYVPFSDAIPFAEDDRWEFDMSFYRWVTVMFLLQALLFKLPYMLWHELKGYSGLNIEKVVAMVQETSMMPQEEREKKLGHAALFMHHWLQTYQQYRFSIITHFCEKISGIFFCFGKRTGTYLTGLYMFVKILYVGNIIGQFFLLSAFLDCSYWNFGINATQEFFKKGRWQDHVTFPRIGLCDYKIRQMANVQTFSVQCVLSVNLFLEKMYLLLWFWMIGLLSASVINLGMGLADNVLPGRLESFMSQYKKLLEVNSSSDKSHFQFKKFVHSYLRNDGVFIIRMVAKNAGHIASVDLVKQLWAVFYKERARRDGHHLRNGAPKAVASAPEETEM